MREGFEPQILDTFGGLCTLIDRGDLPIGLSPDNQNVEYLPGVVKSRIGFKELGTRTASRFGSVISFVKSTTGLSGRLLLDFLGSLIREQPAGTFNTITGGALIGNSMRMNGLQIDDDVYAAFSDGKIPKARQRRYNITGDKMRPLSPSGPYDTMTMTPTGGTLDQLPVYGVVVFEYEDGTLSPCSSSAYCLSYYEPTSFAFAAIPKGPAGVVRRRLYLTTRGGGASDFFTHPFLWVNDNTTPTLTLSGATVINDDILRNGFPLPAYCNDSILPPPACGAALFNGRTLLYGLMNMIPYRKADAFLAGYGFVPMLSELGPQNPAFDAGVGTDNIAPSGFSSETFAAGFYLDAAANAVGGAVGGSTGEYGTGWVMTGDGVRPSIGQISCVLNGSNLAQLAKNQKIGIRFRAKKSAGLHASTKLIVAALDRLTGSTVTAFSQASPSILTITANPAAPDAFTTAQTVLSRGLVGSGGSLDVCGLFTITAAGTAITLQGSACTAGTRTANTGRIDSVLGYTSVAGSSLTTDYAWYDLTATVTNLERVGSICIMMSGGANGIPTAGESITIDEYHLYPLTQPYLNSSIFGSEVDDPNHYRAGICELQVNPQDGQKTRSVFELGGSCYVAKEGSIWTIVDNGLDFVAWDVGNVSPTVGTPSLRGVGVGEGFAIIASTTGAYLFQGGSPSKISDEIQPTWETINWKYGHLISVCVDSARRKVYIAVPTGSATSIDKIFVMDYFEGLSTPSAGGGGRKWTIWTIPATETLEHISPTTLDGTLTEGYSIPCFVGGNATTRGWTATQDPTQAAVSDDLGGSASAINSYYETASVGLPMGRSLFGFLMAKIKGSGALTPSIKDAAGTSTNLGSYTLAAAPLHDAEWKLNKVANQIFFKFGTNTTTAYWSLKRMSVEIKRAFSNARGHNS